MTHYHLSKKQRSVSLFLTCCAATLATSFITIAHAAFLEQQPIDSLIKSPALKDSIFVANAKLQLISNQFSFTEGAATDKEGNVFFTDQPNNKIWKYSTDGKLSVFLDKAGRSNGMYFDKEDNLITCADEHDQLWSINKDGGITVLVKDYQGFRLNGPNDLWVDRNGGIYLTDPYYQRDYWNRTEPDAGLGGQHLYYWRKDKNTLTLADSNLAKPNGVVGTPDGKQLYVADISAGLIYQYDINVDGTLINRQLFVKQMADGIMLDEKANLYCAGNGVTIYNKAGVQIEHLDVPEKWTGNLCFGGKDKNILFITASASLYAIPTLMKGVE